MCVILEYNIVVPLIWRILMEMMVDGTGVLQETHVLPLMENTSHYQVSYRYKYSNNLL